MERGKEKEIGERRKDPQTKEGTLGLTHGTQAHEDMNLQGSKEGEIRTVGQIQENLPAEARPARVRTARSKLKMYPSCLSLQCR